MTEVTAAPLCVDTRTTMTYMQDFLFPEAAEAPVLGKLCPKCGEIKSFDEFSRQAKNTDGRRGDCRNCEKKRKEELRSLKGPCSIRGCSKSAGGSKEGWCSTHYFRWKKTGDVQADVPIRTMAARGAGGVDNNGYMRYEVNGRRVLGHRMVMEKILGRELLTEENVHHINGDKLDNRPENLELWSTSQPKGQRVEDKVAWARRIIELYEGITRGDYSSPGC